MWEGCVSTVGYGVLGVSSRQVRVHRFAYELLVGPIPDGLTIDHLCRSKLCVNPDHLEPVTASENTLRGPLPKTAALNILATHCPRGHPYDEANTYRYGNGRKCRLCARDRERARKASLR